jgi:hypothetical protein
MLRRHILRFEKQILSRYRDGFFNRVLAPEGEILSFAPPKESIQRKGGPIAASSCASRFCRGSVKWASCLYALWVHLPTRGIHAAPLRANPDKTCDARRGKRG